jgi:predicted GH43/DUF377 family glycosyl hydrolase
MNEVLFSNLFLIITLLFLGVGILSYYFIAKKKSSHKKNSSIPIYELTRESCNPLFSPQEHRDWENESTFNPAAITDDEGLIHLFYRAIGRGGTSQIGHSISKNGRTFTERSPYPVFQATPEYSVILPSDRVYDQIRYASGGGWAGCEDPKMVVIDDRAYMTYVAFEGWHSIRVALTSIALADLKKNRWNWKKPITISPKGEPHKNWTLFPEKINGKFAILHCISPEILIEYVDDLDTIPFSPIKSRPPHDGNRNYFGRKDHWDSSVRGVGAPPIKTDIGWLVLYHSMDNNDPNKYKLGAMILDPKDPTKILYRAPHPILSPNHHYENDSKPGVIYASGAVIHKNDLIVYYGGGDKHVCVAQTPLTTLLTWLTTYGRVTDA